MVKCAIGLDFGTSSIKGMVLTEKEEVVLKDGISIEYGTDTHPDGATYISLDPRMVYDRMCQLIKRFLAQLPADHKVVAMSFACASGNTLLCDKNGEPLMNAYSWLNSSYKEESLPILGPIDKEASRAISGWGFGGTFPMGHLSHLKLHNPELYAKAGKVCMVGEYINHRLTGKWGLDRSTATPFFFAEQETGKYHKEYQSCPEKHAAEMPIEVTLCLSNIVFRYGYEKTYSAFGIIAFISAIVDVIQSAVKSFG